MAIANPLSNTAAPLSPSRQACRVTHESRQDVTYLIFFTIRNGKEEAFLQLLHPVLNAMRHELSFRNAVLHRDPAASNRYMLYESWADAQDVADIQVHRSYRQAFWSALPDLLENAREVQVWSPMRGDFVFDD
ncbi:antibiotic biosynthesis monooxygenase [Pollutimonas sp. H1-120]|uniref:putative quinol monooxygenase n=1 Tax=Pollutimonas sp. H1-120 TaxID=3148824 RepID=UPI003B52DEEA